MKKKKKSISHQFTHAQKYNQSPNFNVNVFNFNVNLMLAPECDFPKVCTISHVSALLQFHSKKPLLYPTSIDWHGRCKHSVFFLYFSTIGTVRFAAIAPLSVLFVNSLLLVGVWRLSWNLVPPATFVLCFPSLCRGWAQQPLVTKVFHSQVLLTAMSRRGWTDGGNLAMSRAPSSQTVWGLGSNSSLPQERM